MKKRMVVTIYIVFGTVTVRLGIDKSVRNSQSNGPLTAKKKTSKQNKTINKYISRSLISTLSFISSPSGKNIAAQSCRIKQNKK